MTERGHRATDMEIARANQHIRRAAARIPTAVTLLTVLNGHQPHATTVSAIQIASFSPPLMLVLLATNSRTNMLVRQAGVFGVSVLGEATPEAPTHFGSSSRLAGWDGMGGDQFIRADPRPPRFAYATAWFACSVQRVVSMGDHDGFVAAVDEWSVASGETPIVAYRGRLRALGKPISPADWEHPDWFALTDSW